MRDPLSNFALTYKVPTMDSKTNYRMLDRQKFRKECEAYYFPNDCRSYHYTEQSKEFFDRKERGSRMKMECRVGYRMQFFCTLPLCKEKSLGL